MNEENYQLFTETREGYLIARASGERNLATVSAMTLEIFDAATANNLSKVLVDVRGLNGRLSILDSYLIVTDVFQKLRGKGLRKAAIVDGQQPPLREWFLETAAYNRGFNFRIFSTQEDALEWLVM